MFQGRVNTAYNQILLRVTDGIICDGTIGLTSNILSKRLTSTMETVSSIQLDFLFYKIFDNFGFPKNTSDSIRGLVTVTSLLQSESSVYVRDVCRRWISKINQYIPQQLPSLVTGQNIENTYIRSFYHTHLQDALKQDAVTGWLLYASFYYVIGQYNVTLRITDYVLSKCTPDKIYEAISLYNQKVIHDYSEHFQSKSIKLSDKIKLVTISPVIYLQHSSLIPDELQLEIQNGNISIPPVVLCHCLKLLSFYHIGDLCNK
ncbi:unnamed protein product [Mytilus coruscus]|uniref:Uncharacterized protein n=1 Tax=Mytilus coruscus TaxID=42192 RepID=A0A6J8C4D9_MYTCO|nr:unnamed protein product [Mytilus coruscus]